MKAGVAKVVITPPVGCDLAGYIGRLQPSAGIHDDLHVRALVLDDGNCAAALLSIDLIGLSRGEAERLRAAVHEATGIPGANVMVACSHTHSGPSTEPFTRLGKIDREWLIFLEKAAAGCVRWAASNLVPVRLGVGSGDCGIGVNRRAPIPPGSVELRLDYEGVVDREAGVLRFDTEEGRPLAAVVNYGCHPVVLGEDNLLVSGDFPSLAMGFVERSLSDQVIALFTNGGAGNVNPIARGSFEIASEIGMTLGAEALKVFLEIKPEHVGRLSVETTTLSLPLQPVTTERLQSEIESCESRLATAQEDAVDRALLSARLDWAREALAQIRSGNESWRRRFELQAIGIGPAVLLGVPCELFAETVLSVKSQVGSHRAYIVTYANGYWGYVPPAQAYDTGGYEVTEAFKYLNTPSSFDPGAEALVVQESTRLVKNAGRDSSCVGRREPHTPL